MKRYVVVLLASAIMAGCQSSGGNYQAGSQGVGPHPMVPTPKAPAGVASVSDRDADPAIKQVGYNQGWGGMQNNNFSERIAKAVPSHGGILPGGGPPYPYQGPADGMGAMGGMPPMPGASGCAHCNGAGCPGCAGGSPGAMMGGGGPMPGAGLMPRFITGRTQIRFIRPTGMDIAWQVGGAFSEPQLTVPARYNFHQARIYRLKLTNIENRPGMELYPTLEVYPGNVKVGAYLAHNAVPIEFTEEDFEQVAGGNFVTKVIYLPDPKFQELAIAGVETLVSTRLDPGVDPVQEASRRGVILAVLRMGSVDLEMPHSPELFPTQLSMPPQGEELIEAIPQPIEEANASTPDENSLGELPTLPLE